MKLGDEYDLPFEFISQSELNTKNVLIDELSDKGETKFSSNPLF